MPSATSPTSRSGTCRHWSSAGTGTGGSGCAATRPGSGSGLRAVVARLGPGMRVEPGEVPVVLAVVGVVVRHDHRSLGDLDAQVLRYRRRGGRIGVATPPLRPDLAGP